MVGILQAIFLGIVQGLTEWFPVSSSGHLALFQNLFGWDVPVLFDIYLHLGTLIVLFIFFWDLIKDICGDLVRMDFQTENSKMAGFIVVGTMVTGIIGMAFHDLFTSMFTNLLGIGYAFLFTGLILTFSNKKRILRRKLNLWDSIIIGFFQSLALIPGVSRSGATIGIGLSRGIDRVKVAKFSFLLSIPAIIGATIIESFGVSEMAVPFLIGNFSVVLVGVVFSAITGYICLKLLMKLIENGKFHYFAYYAFSIGIITILISIIK